MRLGVFVAVGMRSTLLSGIAVLCASCATITGIPRLDHHLVHRPNPSVADLIEHTNCELAKAMLAHKTADGSGVWDHLWQDNFVASIDFTLTATNSEGFNPSVSGVLPTYSLGGVVSPVVGTAPTVPTTNATSAMYNKTLAVGMQQTRTQDRNLDVSYVVDLSKLTLVVRDPTNPDPLKTICGANGKENGHEGLTYVGLRGDLDLSETIELGLGAIETGKAYSVYGTSGPQNRADAQPVLNPLTEPATGVVHPEAASAGAASPSGGKQGGGAQTSSASFSTKIDFTIVEGLNGGPSWNL